MSWRIVVVHNTAKLDLQLQYLVVRSEMKTQKIHISEIALLLVEATSVSLTVGLLAELTRQKVKVIFCDHKRNPSSELISYYGSHDTSNKIRTQITWPQSVKEAVWTEIVREKINKQAEFLLERGKNTEAALLRDYVQQIQWNDATNREGHAAKVYFNALFGMDFSRSQDCPINAALNYGYSLMLSAINREIVMNGYITQLGLFHDNMFNQFNLGSDLMEPYRVLVDRKVCEMKPIEFEHEQKMKLVAMMFENDVEMYGVQTDSSICCEVVTFENDVEMYGAQIYFSNGVFTIGYRDWAPEHEKMGKGVTLTEDEMMKLKELL